MSEYSDTESIDICEDTFLITENSTISTCETDSEEYFDIFTFNPIFIREKPLRFVR